MVFTQLVAVASSVNVQIFALFVAILLIFAWVRRPRNLPPGPRAWPILGNSSSLKKGITHRVFADWAGQHGGVMRVWTGNRLLIILNDINSLKEALVNQAEHFSDRVVPPMFKFFMPLKGSIIHASGNIWKKRRRFGLSAMKNLGMGKRSVEHKINEEARHLLESFDSKGEQPFDPEHAVTNAISNIICTISFGYRFEYSNPEFATFIKFLKTNLTSGGFISIGNLFPFLFRTRLFDERRKRSKKIREFLQGIVEEHRESFDENHMRDIIDMCLLKIKQDENAGVDSESATFSVDTLWRTMFDLFVAGSDTSTNTILWLLLYMAIHPDVQDKVQGEIDDVIGCDRQPAFEDHNRMPYTYAVLMEVLRIRPVAPNGVPRQTSHQAKLLGFTIPKRTVVLSNLWATMHDPKQWKDPEKFDPSRFLSADGKKVEKPEAFVPFGIGSRICIGENLAKTELFLFAVNLLQRFTISLPAGKPRPSLEGITGVGMRPYPFEIVAKSR